MHIITITPQIAYEPVNHQTDFYIWSLAKRICRVEKNLPVESYCIYMICCRSWYYWNQKDVLVYISQRCSPLCLVPGFFSYLIVVICYDVSMKTRHPDIAKFRFTYGFRDISKPIIGNCFIGLMEC